MKRICFAIIIFLSTGEWATAQLLKFEDFKTEVMQNDPGFKAAELSAKGSRQATEAGTLATDIRLFSTLIYSDNGGPTQNPSFQGTRTEYRQFSLGLQQQSEFGPKWSLSHNITKTYIEDASPLAIPVPDFYDVYPKLEVSIPLWRNWLGREVRGEVQQTQKALELGKVAAQIDYAKKMAEIETSYYGLQTTRELFKIQQDSLTRAQRLLGWAQARAAKNLGEISDVYQMQALVQARQIELENAKINLQDSARKFNSLRGLASEVVPETLEPLKVETPKLNLDKNQNRKRLDMVIAATNLETEEGRLIAQREKIKPQLDLNFSYQKIGRDPAYPEAHANLDYNNWAVSVNFNMPLNFAKSQRINNGFESQVEAKQKSLEREATDQKLNWVKTVEQGEQIQRQLTLLQELEKIQKLKADEERSKLSKGRSTTFQVISFEQDYHNTRAQRLGLELTAQQFISNLRMFQE